MKKPKKEKPASVKTENVKTENGYFDKNRATPIDAARNHPVYKHLGR